MAGADVWIPRLENGGEPNYVDSDLFTIKVYHGGHYDHIEKKYIGGSISYYDDVDKDKMSLTEVYGMMMGINRSYAGKKIDYYYSIGSEEDIVTKLNNDGDALMMCCCVPRVRLVILYLDHRYLDPENNEEDDDLFIYEAYIPLIGFSQAGSSGEKSSVGVEELLASHNRLPDSSKKHKRYKRCANRQGMTALKLNEPQDEIPTQTRKAPTIDPSDKGKKKKEDDYEDEFGSDCEDAFEDGVDYNPAKGDDEYAGYGVDDDFLFNWLTEPEGDVNKGVYQYKLDADEDEVIEVEDEEAMFEAVDSDEEGIGPEYNSDDGFEVDKFPEFNPKIDMKNPYFFKGLKFATARILRAALRERAIQDGWEVLFDKSDSDRIHAICKADNCDFELRATRMQHESTLLVRKYIGGHTCARVHENTMVRTPYLVERFSQFIKLNPDISTENFRGYMAAEVRASVSFQQAYRTKRAALEMLEKSMNEQYARVQDYAKELKRVDPNTTVDIKCNFNNPQQLPIFKRMYISLGALKQGFKVGCRPILELDGCHLKSPYGGQLLSAVGLDANNTTWVVAYAQVEMENKDSWDWFLRLLVKDLEITGEGNGFTFISDKQKGLIPACESVLPLADHRFCVRHLWTNFNKKFPGKVIKDQLWAIAKSTTIVYYDKEMILMKQICPAAVDWLTDPKRNPKHWCRAHFNTFLKCDVLLNNLCESFNAAILPARLKPVITCFEEIRVRMMKRIAVRKDKMSKVLDPICPKPRVILEKNKVKAVTDCIPQGTGSTKIEVQSIGGSKYVVDLAKRMCACRRWDLTGIPCKHAIAAINFMRQKPEEFVDACYLTKTYMATYSNTIQPVNGMSLWIPSEEPAILPPEYNRQPGRPKTKRVKNASELENDGPKLGRVQRSLKCSRCGVLGHNITTCHRHLPPKEKALNTSKKRKLNNGSTSSSASASASKVNGTKDPPKTKNELRAKAAKRAEDAKEKRAAQRAAARATSKPAQRGRPPKAATNSGKAALSKAKDSAPQASQASSTTSVRIRDNAKNGRK